MEDFLQHLKSLDWWLSVVLVGLLLDMIAPGARKVFLRFAARFARRLADSSARLQEKRARRLQILRSSPQVQILVALTASRRLALSFLETMGASVLFALGLSTTSFVRIAAFVLGSLVAVMAVPSFVSALALGTEVERIADQVLSGEVEKEAAQD